ncbi:alpha/beta fold hydrolase [Hamadaea tsunoensis]|uniref:alpha/beta fold hydrolase n=1 Tax=Hamadaea tsunoensis TaxID=53368 RepID=UPI00054F2577|nr:alpha/beta fold hydrolase [Hamadaea tsunoensis]
MFVLVPGAWLGAWVWDAVAERLRTGGHEVRAVTLAGLAERAVADPSAVGPEEHVEDLLAALDPDRRSVLVAHSYAGIVAGTVAQRVPERIARAVYLDANLPVAGQSMVDGWSEGGQKYLHDLVAASGGWWPAPRPIDFEGHASAEQAEFLSARATPHPARTVTEPVRLAGSVPPGVYLACVRPSGGLSAEARSVQRVAGWRIETLESGHWPMVSAPDALTESLLRIAETTL